MLTFDQVLTGINEIGATSSRNEKEELLRNLLADETAAWAFKMAYDPFKVYGLTADRRTAAGFTPKSYLNEGLIVVAINNLLEKLITRTLTGGDAEKSVREMIEFLPEAAAEILFRIIRKDMMCGIGAPTIQKIMPGLIPVFSVMRAQTFEEKRVKAWPVIVEPKLDGFRYSFLCREGQGGFFTRSGEPAPAVNFLVQPTIELARAYVAAYPTAALTSRLFNNGALNFMLDGEMISGEAFAETSSALRKGEEQAENAVFHIFDLMTLEDFTKMGSTDMPYLERRKLVEEFAGFSDALPETKGRIKRTERYFANSLAEVMGFYAKFRARDLEGAMVKLPDGGYDKKKSWGWMKIKPKDTEDLRIVGFYPGEKYTKYENCLGGLVVRRFHPGIGPVEVDVGGGFKDDERQIFWDWIQADLGIVDKSAVTDDGKGRITVADHVYLSGTKLLFNLAQVEFQEVTPDGSLRHPRYQCLRDDKRGEVERERERDAA